MNNSGERAERPCENVEVECESRKMNVEREVPKVKVELEVMN